MNIETCKVCTTEIQEKNAESRGFICIYAAKAIVLTHKSGVLWNSLKNVTSNSNKEGAKIQEFNEQLFAIHACATNAKCNGIYISNFMNKSSLETSNTCMQKSYIDDPSLKE